MDTILLWLNLKEDKEIETKEMEEELVLVTTMIMTRAEEARVSKTMKLEQVQAITMLPFPALKKDTVRHKIVEVEIDLMFTTFPQEMPKNLNRLAAQEVSMATAHPIIFIQEEAVRNLRMIGVEV